MDPYREQADDFQGIGGQDGNEKLRKPTDEGLGSRHIKRYVPHNS